MDLLVIDTATERGMFAYTRNGEVLCSHFLPFGLQEAQKLLGKLTIELEQHNLSLQAIDAIAVGVGPGSYTGIRIAATIGKMLSFALSKPLTGICTLQLFAPECATNTPFAVAIDAKIAGIYLQIGEKSKDIATFSSPPQILPLKEAVEQLKKIPIIVSPNVKPIRERLKGHAQDEWTWQELPPSPQQMAHTAADLIRRGSCTTTGKLELMYMRKTQAEIEADQRKRTP